MATLEGKWGLLMAPGSQGGINWPGGSYDPESHMVYIFSKTTPQVAGVVANPNAASDFKLVRGNPPGAPGRGGRGAAADSADPLSGPIRPGLAQVAGLPLVKPPYGRITALDLKDGTLAWQIAHGETPDSIRNHPLLKGLNIPRTGQAAHLAPLVTKTLLICGDGGPFTDEQGRNAARLRAYDKTTGKELGAVFLDAPQTGTPMTYALGGWQYIVLAISGAGIGGSQLVAYRLRQV
jgi:quinoprotein glucose dehydrogenase